MKPVWANIALCVFALFVGGSWLVVLLPQLTVWALVWSVLTCSFSLYLAPLALLGFWWAVYQWRKSRRIFAACMTCICTAAIALAFVPWIATSRTAHSNGVKLSALQYFSFGPAIKGPNGTYVYATIGGQKLSVDVWMPRFHRMNQPAIVYVHGGGWTFGSRGQRQSLLQWLSNEGYTVFDIDYRLKPQPLWRQETGDVKCAVGWVAQNAKRFSIDPNNIVLAGNSAGGNLAMLAAYTVGTGAFPSTCQFPETRVKAVITTYAPTDTSDMHSGVPSLVKYTNGTYFGGSPKSVPEVYRQTSPLTFVRPGLPPTLQFQGLTDHLEPHEEAEWMDAALANAGVPHRTILIPWTEHLFDRAWGAWSSQIERGVMLQFLKSYASKSANGLPPSTD